MNPQKLVIILGGARSGKSAFAEGLVTGPRTYIATAQAFDDEMRVRIAQHRKDRGSDWHTVEAPLDLVEALQSAPIGDRILIDCMTLWLSNLMLADRDIELEVDRFLTSLTTAPQSVVCVSNEVGMGLVPNNALGRRFRDAQGMLNRKLANRADLAVFVVAGLPIVLKG